MFTDVSVVDVQVDGGTLPGLDLASFPVRAELAARAKDRAAVVRRCLAAAARTAGTKDKASPSTRGATSYDALYYDIMGTLQLGHKSPLCWCCRLLGRGGAPCAGVWLRRCLAVNHW